MEVWQAVDIDANEGVDEDDLLSLLHSCDVLVPKHEAPSTHPHHVPATPSPYPPLPSVHPADDPGWQVAQLISTWDHTQLGMLGIADFCTMWREDPSLLSHTQALVKRERYEAKVRPRDHTHFCSSVSRGRWQKSQDFRRNSMHVILRPKPPTPAASRVAPPYVSCTLRVRVRTFAQDAAS